MTYYKMIDGHQYDALLINLAESAVAGSGDGRISMEDAKALLDAVKDGDSFTEIEKQTVKYLHQNFHWTDSAFLWFNEQLKAWQSEFEKPVRMSLQELSNQSFPEYDVLITLAERQAREHDLKAATSETYSDHDEIAMIVRLASGKRVQISSNFIELAGNYVELRGGFDLPVRAIEKITI